MLPFGKPPRQDTYGKYSIDSLNLDRPRVTPYDLSQGAVSHPRAGPGALRDICMQSSKDRILAVLKRFGQRSVDDLAVALQLAPMTIRQHLTALERDEFVTMTESRSGAGRPKHVYSLTARGDAVFPRRYDRFAALLLSELQTLDPDALRGTPPEDRMGLVLEQIARRESAPHVERLAQLSTDRRARAAAAILHEIGGFAEAVETHAGIEIRDYNCVYRGLRPQESGPCGWHHRLMPMLLLSPVEHLEMGQDGGGCRALVRCPDDAWREGLPARARSAAPDQTWSGATPRL